MTRYICDRYVHFHKVGFESYEKRGRSTEEDDDDGEGVRLAQTFLSGTAEDLIRFLNSNTGMLRSSSNYCKEKKSNCNEVVSWCNVKLSLLYLIPLNTKLYGI